MQKVTVFSSSPNFGFTLNPPKPPEPFLAKSQKPKYQLKETEIQKPKQQCKTPQRKNNISFSSSPNFEITLTSPKPPKPFPAKSKKPKYQLRESEMRKRDATKTAMQQLG